MRRVHCELHMYYRAIETGEQQGPGRVKGPPKTLAELHTYSGLELARVPRVPGTRRNSEHHLWHPWILRFLILTGTRRAHSM